MKSRERIRAAIAGEAVDRVPVSAWRHFPEQDQTAEALAENTVAWHETWRWDFEKFMPPGDYATIDWGAVTEFTGAPVGNRTTVKPVIQSIDDWKRLEPLDVQRGFNGMVLDALRMSRERIDPDVPLLQTIFSPLTIAQKLANGDVVAHLRERPETIHAALEVITQVTCDMVQASYEAGADGLFFASQLTTREVATDEEYRAFGIPYDLRVIEKSRAVRDDGIVFFHTHGDAPMLELAAEYPVDIVNWHDRLSGPPLREGYEIVGKAVGGGINQVSMLEDAPEAIAADAKEAIASMDSRHLLVTPGCVVRYATSEDRIRALDQAVRG